MKIPKKFSIGFLLVVVALVAGYLAGHQRGEDRGFASVTAAANNIHVIATVLTSTAEGNSVLAVEHFKCPDGEMKTLSGGDLGDLAIDITPYRFESDSLTRNFPITTASSLEGGEKFGVILPLKNAPVLDVEKAMNKDLSKECKTGTANVKSDVVSNSIILKSNSKAKLEKMILMAESFDMRPDMFKAKLMIRKKNTNGTIQYLSRPSIVTIEGGSPAAVSIGQKEIMSQGKLIQSVDTGVTVKLQMFRDQPDF